MRFLKGDDGALTQAMKPGSKILPMSTISLLIVVIWLSNKKPERHRSLFDCPLSGMPKGAAEVYTLSLMAGGAAGGYCSMSGTIGGPGHGLSLRRCRRWSGHETGQ